MPNSQRLMNKDEVVQPTGSPATDSGHGQIHRITPQHQQRGSSSLHVSVFLAYCHLDYVAAWKTICLTVSLDNTAAKNSFLHVMNLGKGSKTHPGASLWLQPFFTPRCSHVRLPVLSYRRWRVEVVIMSFSSM